MPVKKFMFMFIFQKIYEDYFFLLFLPKKLFLIFMEKNIFKVLIFSE